MCGRVAVVMSKRFAPLKAAAHVLECVLSTRFAAAFASPAKDVRNHAGGIARIYRTAAPLGEQVWAMSPRLDAYVSSAVPAEDDGTVAPQTADQQQSRGRRALDVLYRSQAGRLLRLFNRRTDPQDAADLVQETFTRFAHATLERDDAPDCPESYLTRVAVNVLNDRSRNASHRAMLYAVPIEDANLAAPDQQAAIEARDVLNRVDMVMMQLKPMTRDIFIARRYHGFSRAEIAEKTGLSVKGVDKQLAKAFEHLHRHLGGYHDQ